MATKKDLVEAHAFSRRRLVTAFVSGAPGGREVEPARPGRTIVGGVALAVLLVAGGAIAGVFTRPPGDEWTEPGLVISKDTGAAYVITAESSDPILRPVVNNTSAKLILGPDAEPTVVDQELIDGERIGDDIGILGAPASLPGPGQLIDEGWTACTRDGGGVKLDLGATPAVATTAGDGQAGGAPPLGFTVRSGRDHYLVGTAGPDHDPVPHAFRYRLPGGEGGARDRLLEAVGLPVAASATEVPTDWLNLLPQGPALGPESLGLEEVGQRVGYAGGGSGLPASASVGDLVTGASGDFVLTRTGPAPLDEFAAAVYSATSGRPTLPVDRLDVQRDAPIAPPQWPGTTMGSVVGEHCLVLQPQPGEGAAVVLATDPQGEASAEDVPAGRRVVSVDTGRGAYVLSSSPESGDAGTPFVVDAKGRRYQLVGAGTADLLGYAEHPVRTVPDSWVELFTAGVQLSQNAALCAPDAGVGGDSTSCA